MRGFSLFLGMTVFLIVADLQAGAFAADIHDAAKKGDVAGIAAALDSGADVDADEGSGTPLYIAVRRGNVDAATLLLDRGANVDIATSRGPAFMAAVAKNNFELIELLIDHGADPNTGLDGEAVLHVAVKQGCLDCVKKLVAAGANVNAQTSDGKTPLHLAKTKGNAEIASYLVDNGVVVPVPAPISAKLANGDIKKGQAYFADECASCHSIEPNGAAKNGPHLWGVVGRVKASIEQISYSEALRALGGVWTYEDLNTYLYGPMLTTPGVYMETEGVPDEADRVNVIAYLRTLSDEPIPLP